MEADKILYKCTTCVYHKVDLDKEKCICILEKLNPKRKDMFYIEEALIMSGIPVIDITRHFHQWICTWSEKFLNCPGYKKDET